MIYTVLLGLGAALCWGAPDVWLAQASRRVGPFAVCFGSILVGTLLVLPGAAFVDMPEWTTRGILLGLLLGPMQVVAYQFGFAAYKTGSVAVVTPIIACEGGVAAMIAIAGGERLGGMIAIFLPIAVLGVVLASMGHGGGRAAVIPAAACAITWGAILAVSAPVADDLGGYWGFLLARGSALLVMLPFAIRRGAARRWLEDPWRVSAWAVGDSAAYLLYFYAAARGPVSVAGVLVAQFATVGVLVGIMFGGERLLPRQVLGILLVLVAVSVIAATGG